MTTSANVLADSISPAGHRLTTMAWTYPRIIHAEALRHRMLSRSAASSRAIPVQRFIEQVQNDPFVPSSWGKNQKGMVAEEELPPNVQKLAEVAWRHASQDAMGHAKVLLELGVHKEVTNRLLEPFQWMTEIVTATEWDNFLHLREEKNAHPEIQRLARAVRIELDASKPRTLWAGEWHLPLVSEEERSRPDAKHLSLGRLARVSYLRQDEEQDPAVAVERAEKMRAAAHLSVFEHVARPQTFDELETFRLVWLVVRELVDGEAHVKTWVRRTMPSPEERQYMEEHGTQILDVRETFFCGNFDGWVPLRKEMPYEWDALGKTTSKV